jgi:plasmid stabilization system protein ParE
MARKYRLSRRADIGLAKIWREIAAHNVAAADALYLRILHKIENAMEYPGGGASRPDIGGNVRMLVEGNYNVYYVPAKDGIVVTAIVHSKRLPANWL